MTDQMISAFLASCKANGSLRSVNPHRQNDIYIDYKGEKLINLSSNDYLNLGHDLTIRQEFLAFLSASDALFSSTSSRLLTGTFAEHSLFEEKASKLFHKSCLMFNSGFDANSGILQVLGGKETLFLADKLIHASMIDGIKGSGAKFMRFAHNDIEHLETLIVKYQEKFKEIIIITEAVFSMDGDFAPLNKLVLLKEKYPLIKLYVDEAHSFGVYGKSGLGLCCKLNILDKVDYILCTLGKAAGSCGAFFLCDAMTKEYLINTVRPFIFTTSLPPVNALHASFMLNKLNEAEKRRESLEKAAGQVRSCLKDLGFNVISSSQIIPVVVNTNEAAVKGSEFFKEHGFFVLPIRHPTVPVGQARLRLSLSASMDETVIEKLCAVIEKFKDFLEKDK